MKRSSESTHSTDNYSTTKRIQVPKLRRHLDAYTSSLWLKCRRIQEKIEGLTGEIRSTSPIWNVSFTWLTQPTTTQQPNGFKSQNFGGIKMYIQAGCGSSFGGFRQKLKNWRAKFGQQAQFEMCRSCDLLNRQLLNNQTYSSPETSAAFRWIYK